MAGCDMNRLGRHCSFSEVYDFDSFIFCAQFVTVFGSKGEFNGPRREPCVSAPNTKCFSHATESTQQEATKRVPKAHDAVHVKACTVPVPRQRAVMVRRAARQSRTRCCCISHPCQARGIQRISTESHRANMANIKTRQKTRQGISVKQLAPWKCQELCWGRSNHQSRSLKCGNQKYRPLERNSHSTSTSSLVLAADSAASGYLVRKDGMYWVRN
ncbi:hypothetical protein V8C42DRAFT_335971 [Trichoderma barbatum]